MRHLTREEINKSLKVQDLTKVPDHAISLIMNKIIYNLEKNYSLKADIQRGNPIVKKTENYDKLGYSNNEVTLSSRYTRYIDNHHILRTQMTSVIPGLLEEYSNNLSSSKLWVCPGIVYRRDVVDKTHVGEPHQMDVWLLQKDKQLGRSDLINLVDTIVNTIGEILKEKINYRCNETTHNYTEDGIEVEIYYKGKWLEILECGLAGRKLLSQSGIPSNYSGLALGMGLDRLTMIVKQIEDIRVLRDPDLRVSNQMKNLNKYKLVSKQPSIKRDLSICVDKEAILEELTEKISYVLKENMGLIEEITLISETSYDNLPIVAKERLGILENQKNILIRITLRHPSQSITSEEANRIYTLIYEKIHEGTRGYTIS